MEPQTNQRRVWEIDKRLEALIGCAVRVRAELVMPKRWNGESLPHVIDLKNLILPDGTSADRDPIYVEGILKEFRRNIAVVCVDLDRPLIEGGAEGRISFRGVTAVILRGPATVRLGHPYFVEKIPADAKSYWAHLRSTNPQFELGFD
jgi:hypothetical protein